jgi:hypothetical protein
MHIFIDANIYLSFYEQTPDAFVDLAKLGAVIKGDKAQLWLPDQVKREFWKNREGSIASALGSFEKPPVLPAAPRLVHEDSEFEKLKELAKATEKKKAEIIARVKQEVASEKTIADNEVRKLFQLATEIDTSGEIFTEAHERALRHSPPGKQDGIGDRISWVALLKKLPTKADLHVISMDGDFAGDGNSNEIKPYLEAEWQRKNQGTVKLWKRASQFLAAHFPDAANAIEIERELMIQRLEKSPNFVTTHAVIAEFSDISHLSKPLADRLANALLTNSQVSWLIGDDDVNEFTKTFVAQYGAVITPESKELLEKALAKA